MTIANDVFTPDLAPAPEGRRARRIPVWAWLLAAFALISFARVITGSNEVDSAGTLREAITAFIPIALAGLAGLWSERAGVVNIGLEGMMILGTIGAGYFGTFYGPWQAVIAAMVFGAIGGFTAYAYALKHLPVATVSLYAYVNPLIAVILGTVLLDEPLNPRLAIVATLVLVGIWLVKER